MMVWMSCWWRVLQSEQTFFCLFCNKVVNQCQVLVMYRCRFRNRCRYHGIGICSLNRFLADTIMGILWIFYVQILWNFIQILWNLVKILRNFFTIASRDSSKVKRTEENIHRLGNLKYGIGGIGGRIWYRWNRHRKIGIGTSLSSMVPYYSLSWALHKLNNWEHILVRLFFSSIIA